MLSEEIKKDFADSLERGMLPKFTFFKKNPIVYSNNAFVFCAKCAYLAKDEDDPFIEFWSINWDNPKLYCDECGDKLLSDAYLRGKEKTHPNPLMIRDASRQTNFGKANDKMSRLASELLNARIDEEWSYEEASMMGAGSDCNSLIAQCWEREKQVICERYNFKNMEEASDAVSKLVTHKWIYYSCIFS